MGLAVSLGSIYWVLKNENIQFFKFRLLRSRRGKGVQYIRKFFNHAIAEGLSFRLWSFKVTLSLASGEKIVILAEKVQFLARIP